MLIHVNASDIVMADEARKANKPAPEANPIAFALRRRIGAPAKVFSHSATWECGDECGRLGHRAQRWLAMYEKGKKLDPFEVLLIENV